eukprot:TRINITY_DN34002_c0_g1_i1.p1 TRINITY_DN34002_c0_g1~~TRINITY_DN34002_c0_g1_i1.p1  ORF type:complete len:394 (-),score=55.25 TRINITY_DN34002_c0_g1_i1:108-1289(-)
MSDDGYRRLNLTRKRNHAFLRRIEAGRRLAQCVAHTTDYDEAQADTSHCCFIDAEAQEAFNWDRRLVKTVADRSVDLSRHPMFDIGDLPTQFYQGTPRGSIASEEAPPKMQALGALTIRVYDDQANLQSEVTARSSESVITCQTAPLPNLLQSLVSVCPNCGLSVGGCLAQGSMLMEQTLTCTCSSKSKPASQTCSPRPSCTSAHPADRVASRLSALDGMPTNTMERALAHWKRLDASCLLSKQQCLELLWQLGVLDAGEDHRFEALWKSMETNDDLLSFESFLDFAKYHIWSEPLSDQELELRWLASENHCDLFDLERWKAAFDRFDCEGRGTLDAEQCHKACACTFKVTCEELSQAMSSRLFSMFARNAEFIEFAEFASLCNAVESSQHNF